MPCFTESAKPQQALLDQRDETDKSLPKDTPRAQTQLQLKNRQDQQRKEHIKFGKHLAAFE